MKIDSKKEGVKNQKDFLHPLAFLQGFNRS